MKIVVLDGFTLNPGDLSWRALQELGEVEIFDRTSEDLIQQRAEGADIVLTNKTPLSEAVVAKLPKLKYIGVLATGYNVVDVKAAKAKGIVVTNVPAYSTNFVAQHTFALILEICNNVGIHNESVARGEWSRQTDFSYWKAPLIELAGKTLGIIGLGKIGSEVAKLGLAFGMNVIANHKHPERDKMDGVVFLSLDDVCAQSDFLTLHCPLNEENKGFINKPLIEKMKPSAFLINTSRGALINEKDLAKALNIGTIAGAALDVLSSEPPSDANPLLKAKNCIITPHIAWASKEARHRLLDIAVDNIKAFINKTIRNHVA